MHQHHRLPAYLLAALNVKAFRFRSSNSTNPGHFMSSDVNSSYPSSGLPRRRQLHKALVSVCKHTLDTWQHAMTYSEGMVRQRSKLN